MGDVTITNVIPMHMESVTAKLLEMGVHVTEGPDTIRVQADHRPGRVTIKTLPYPGFPTDLQQPISSLLCVAEGTSMVVENIFEDRFKHLTMLQRMGAKSSVSGRVAVIEGVDRLYGCLLYTSMPAWLISCFLIQPSAFRTESTPSSAQDRAILSI